MNFGMLQQAIADGGKMFVSDVMQREAEARKAQYDEARALREDSLSWARTQREAQLKQQMADQEVDSDLRIDGKLATKGEIKQQLQANKLAETTKSEWDQKRQAAIANVEDQYEDMLPGDDESLDQTGKYNAEMVMAQNDTTPDKKAEGIIGSAKKVTSAKAENNEALLALKEATLNANIEKAKAQIEVAQAKLESTATTAKERMELTAKIADQNARLRELQILSHIAGKDGKDKELSPDRLMTASTQYANLAEKTTDPAKRKEYMDKSAEYADMAVAAYRTKPAETKTKVPEDTFAPHLLTGGDTGGGMLAPKKGQPKMQEKVWRNGKLQ